ncbi:MAG: argininosuccinate lyase [Saprospiraceae bacterium]|nr:argininosuccinate lyase [Saprospiraceae bacterium]
MKLWSNTQTINELVEKFTIGQDNVLDLRLARFDVLGTLAHIEMLASIGLLTAEELAVLQPALRAILGQIEAGEFTIEPGVEDVHSQVELLLTRSLGDVGKKIHAGRSRNDQVLVDLRLFFRSEIRQVTGLVGELFEVLMAQAAAHEDVPMPGYTHTQVAMVSSFGLWFSAYAESLADDLRLWQSVFDIINQNPLGSAAGYGSSFPLDRRMTTQLLGFKDLNYNVLHAQMGRGKSEQFLSFAMAGLAATLGKFAADVCLFNSQNFGFLKLPTEFTTGSSIMPHKKNPDVFELIRGRCSRLQTLPQQVSAVTANLTSGYHRDFQILKETVFPAMMELKNCLRLAILSIPKFEVNEHILSDEKYRYLFTVEVVNRLVLDGVPFREAYRQVAQQVEEGTFQFEGEISHTHEGSIGNLCLDEIRRKFGAVLAGFDFEGSVGVAEQLGRD